MKTIGIILIVIGIAMIVLKGINFQTQKKVAEVGPIEVNKTENNHVGWPTYTGAVIGIIGVVLLVSGAKTSKKA
jgi:hypothetical protein